MPRLDQPLNTDRFVWALCPQPPEWRINWKVIQTLPAIAALKGCRQDPEHHGEGDVLTHTMMVCEALTKLEQWRGLPALDRTIVFLAALLHDIAKPLCTRTDDEGNISSREHTRRGASYARLLLWQGFPGQAPPFAVRHAVDRLVRYSGLPLWLLEKPDPSKAARRASLAVRLDWLALLAEADVRGRKCRDNDELLDRVFLFKDFCLEENCFYAPATFSSPHSCFSYFRTESKLPERDVFDSSKFSVTLMSGLPAAGKDYWIDHNRQSMPVISLDEIRLHLRVAPQDDQSKVVSMARDEARKHLRAETPFIWNATNVSKVLRSGLIDFFHNYNARIRIVFVEPASYADLLTRNRARTEPVPEAVIEKLALRMEVPEPQEGHELFFAVDD